MAAVASAGSAAAAAFFALLSQMLHHKVPYLFCVIISLEVLDSACFVGCTLRQTHLSTCMTEYTVPLYVFKLDTCAKLEPAQ